VIPRETTREKGLDFGPFPPPAAGCGRRETGGTRERRAISIAEGSATGDMKKGNSI